MLYTLIRNSLFYTCVDFGIPFPFLMVDRKEMTFLIAFFFVLG